MLICPECKVGKHQNCNGFGGVDDEDPSGKTLFLCGCFNRIHYTYTI